jgi:hypothetical protein
MTKYKHRLDTMDEPIEWEDDIPPIPIKTPEEKAEELERDYSRSDKATCYKCNRSVCW